MMAKAEFSRIILFATLTKAPFWGRCIKAQETQGSAKEVFLPAVAVEGNLCLCCCSASLPLPLC